MKYLLTGHKGFIGSHLYNELKLQNRDVVGKDLIEGADLCNSSFVDALEDFDVVLHLAAFNGTKHFYSAPTEVLINNTLPTINLTNRYKNSDTRFIFTSTCEIFNGAIDAGFYEVPTDEKVPVVFQDILNPRWSYSIPKALGENLIHNAMKNYAIIRYFNIYGPGQKDHFISEFVERALDGRFEIYGNDTRSFCYVEDAVNMTLELANSTENGIFNIGSSVEHKIENVARIIMEIMGYSASELEIYPSPNGSVTRRCPDLTKIGHISNHIKTDLTEGLEKTVKDLMKK